MSLHNLVTIAFLLGLTILVIRFFAHATGAM